MTHEIIARLHEALDRIDEIGTHIEGRSLADFRQDRMFQAGLEQTLVMLGRTLGGVLKHDPALADTIPLAPDFVAMGETMVRDYDTLDHDAIWTAATRDLPRLATQIKASIATYVETPLPIDGHGTLIPMVDVERPALTGLFREYGVTRMLVFGSAANGTFDPVTSDLDFAVDLGDYEPGVAHRYIDFADALEALFDRPVDVVTLHDRMSERFRSELDRTAITIYETIPDLHKASV